MTQTTYITNNSRQTKNLGRKFGETLRGGETLCLYGALGSGKTTFTQGLARGLQIKNRLLSPTFIIVRHYNIINKPFTKLYHLDLYRLENPQSVMDLGFIDFINDKTNVIVIEWPEKLGEFLPKNRIDIYFKDLGDDKREISIKKFEAQNPKSLPAGRQAKQTQMKKILK